MKIVRNPNRWLKKLSRAAALLSLVAGSQAVMAQDGGFSFGRTPSGSASEVVDSNRHGLGVLFHGGHMAGDTVGRDDSISHISLAPYVNVDNSFLFGDSRLIRSNGGQLAWTFGSGYRQYIEDYDFVAGVNGYFDRSELTGAALNQWGAGAELLAHGWELRGNIYETFGDSSALVGQRVAPNSAAFAGENITFTRLDTFASSLRGFDTEAGFLLPGDFAERIDLRAFAGGYMYEGDAIDQFGGWSSRLQADIGKWLELGLKVTDDKMFNTTVMFSAAVHFGGFESQEHTRRSAIQRFREPVRRNMHVVATTADVAVGGQLAVNPDTGLPLTVAHVNSNDTIGPFLGTPQDPFQLLSAGLAAGKDIVFVHAGSVFNAPPENIVSLASGTKLLGEGLISSNRDVNNLIQVQALGQTLTLALPDSPTFAANPTLIRPQLIGSAGDAVTLASNTQFSGFIIDSPSGNGIFSNGATGTIISDVLVTGAGGSAIRLQNTAGTTTITDTTLIAAGAGTAPVFFVNGGNGQVSFRSTDDNFLASITNTSAGHSLLIENMTGGLVDMSSSSITETGGDGILIQNNTGGNAIVDNVSLTGSLGTGIAILNSDGVYTFRKSSAQLQQITVDNAAQQGILIDDAGGTVSFAENVLVSNRNAEGIEILNSSGHVRFAGQVTVADLGAGIGTEAGVFVHNQQAGASVTFSDDLIIRGATRGSLGNGVLLTNNNAGSVFTVNENTSIAGTDLASIAIDNNNGQVRFEGSTAITQRLVEGVAITNSAGAILFGETNNNALTVSNDLIPASQSAAILATNNSANISVANAIVTNAQGNAGGGAGIHLVGNTGDINFGTIDVDSIDGVGLFGLNNKKIGINGGAIVSDQAAAVNIENTGIDIKLTSVTSTGSPDYGIRLVETNKDNLKTFKVSPTNQNVVAGDGGTIDGAKGDGLDNDDAAGVFLRNAGQVSLRGMLITDNEFGIRIRNTESISGLADSTKQNFILDTSIVQDSDIRGLDSQNLMLLEITDSTFDNNGDDAAAGRETILLDYTVRLDPDTIIRVDQGEDP
ncbi:MAG: inverse autotransporter beta domain-containing protein, partial [Planctomycetota bacterium]